MTIRTYASPITVADAMDTMKDVDDCIKEIDSIMYRLAIMDKQLIAQENYINLSKLYANYRINLYKHRRDSFSISAGTQHNLILNNGYVFSFGYNYYGQLGHGDDKDRSTPTRITTNGIVDVSTGWMHGLVLDESGKVYSFGYNSNGQLGLGHVHPLTVPTKITSLNNIIAISAGGDHSLVLDKEGRVFSFGDNNYGQLGHGYVSEYRSTPTQITKNGIDSKIISAISAGSTHSLVLDENGHVFSFGENTEGELGQDGDRKLPTKITSLNNIIAISAGGYHSLVLDVNGHVFSFGSNTIDQLGRETSTRTDQLEPTKITSLILCIPINQIFNSSQILPGVTTSDVDPERIVLTDDKEVFNGVDIIGTKQFLIGVNSILTHPNNINQTLVTGGDVDQPYELMVAANAYRVFNTGTYPYSAGAKHELSTGVLKGLLMQGNKNITGTASYNTILTAIPDNGLDSDTNDHFEVIRGFGLK